MIEPLLLISYQSTPLDYEAFKDPFCPVKNWTELRSYSFQVENTYAGPEHWS
jgi:hypothetical protein